MSRGARASTAPSARRLDLAGSGVLKRYCADPMAKPPIQEMSTRLLAVELGSGKRWKRMALIGSLGGALLAGGIYVAVRTIDARERASLEVSGNGLNTCLLGEPLAAGETPRGRVLAVQLAVLG